MALISCNKMAHDLKNNNRNKKDKSPPSYLTIAWKNISCTSGVLRVSLRRLCSFLRSVLREPLRKLTLPASSLRAKTSTRYVRERRQCARQKHRNVEFFFLMNISQKKRGGDTNAARFKYIYVCDRLVAGASSLTDLHFITKVFFRPQSAVSVVA